MSTAKGLFSVVAVDRFTEMLLELGDPDEILKKLQIQRKDLRALMGDDEIMAALDTRVEAVVATSWRLEPGTGRAIKWLWSELEPHMPEIVRGAMSALPYGFAVQEVVYAWKEGRIGIGSVEEKPFEWFSFKPSDGSLLYRDMMGELINCDEVYPGKFLLTQHEATYRNPHGEALFTRLYWPWMFRVNGWKFWSKTLERTGTPFLKGIVPPGTSPDSTGAMKDNVQNMLVALKDAVQNAAIAMPTGWDVQFLSAAQTGSSFEQFEHACIKRIQRLILGQTLTSDTGSDGGGSYALGQVHNEVRMDRRNADIRMVSMTINKLVANLWSLNGFSGNAPAIIMEDGQGLEMPRAERDAKLVQAGICKLTPEYLLRTYDFEEGDFEIPEPPPMLQLPTDPNNPPTDPNAPPESQNPDPTAPDKGEKPANAADLSILTFAPATGPTLPPDQIALDEGAGALVEANNSTVMNAMLKPVIDLVQNAASYDEIMEGLAKTFPKMDAAQLEDRMARAMFAADIWGMLNANEK